MGGSGLAGDPHSQADPQKTTTQTPPPDDKARVLPPVNSTATRGEKSLIDRKSVV